MVLSLFNTRQKESTDVSYLACRSLLTQRSTLAPKISFFHSLPAIMATPWRSINCIAKHKLGRNGPKKNFEFPNAYTAWAGMRAFNNRLGSKDSDHLRYVLRARSVVTKTLLSLNLVRRPVRKMAQQLIRNTVLIDASLPHCGNLIDHPQVTTLRKSKSLAKSSYQPTI